MVHLVFLDIDSCLLANNSALCSTCSAGAVLADTGLLTVRDSVFAGNYARYVSLSITRDICLCDLFAIVAARAMCCLSLTLVSLSDLTGAGLFGGGVVILATAELDVHNSVLPALCRIAWFLLCMLCATALAHRCSFAAVCGQSGFGRDARVLNSDRRCVCLFLFQPSQPMFASRECCAWTGITISNSTLLSTDNDVSMLTSLQVPFASLLRVLCCC